MDEEERILIWSVVVQGRYGTYKFSLDDMLQMVREEAERPDGIQSIVLTPHIVSKAFIDRIL